MKKLVIILLSIGLIAVCAFIALPFVLWRIPQPASTKGMALADLDGDGDLDAFLANGRHENTEPNTVLFNDGSGHFSDSDQQLGQADSRSVILYDFDDDGDVDALVSNFWAEYYWNDGAGIFTQNQKVDLPAVNGFPVGIWRFKSADLNGDGHIDLFLAGCCGGGLPSDSGGMTPLNTYNTVWLGANDKLPRTSDQQFGTGSSEMVDLADLDGDGDLDAFAANSAHMDERAEPVDYDSNMVWLNNGQGVFTDNGQQLGDQRSYAIALGDLDGDGDSDAFVGNLGPDEVWLNDGQAGFTDSGQAMDDRLTRFVTLADLDGDNDLDAYAGNDSLGKIWLNDGRGVFSDSGQVIRHGSLHAVSVGDVDGDGDVDIVAGKIDGARVWFNDGSGRMR